MAFDEEKETFDRVETDEIITKGHKNEISIFLENLQDILGLDIRDGYDTVKERLDSYIKKYVRNIWGCIWVAGNQTKYGVGGQTVDNVDERNAIICENGKITKLCVRAWNTMEDGSQVRIDVLKYGDETGLYLIMGPEYGSEPQYKTSPTVDLSTGDLITFKVKELGGINPAVAMNIGIRIESL